MRIGWSLRSGGARCDLAPDLSVHLDAWLRERGRLWYGVAALVVCGFATSSLGFEEGQADFGCDPTLRTHRSICSSRRE